MADPITDEVEHKGDVFHLRLRPVRDGYRWYLNYPDGSDLTMGQDTVAGLEEARTQALSFLQRMWPEGRRRPQN